MPSKPPSPCLHPGCRALVPDGAYCDAHRRQRSTAYAEASRRNTVAAQKDDARLALASRIRDSAEWQRAREVFRAQNPLCCDPFNFHGTQTPSLTKEVHHVIPLIERPDLALDPDNLRPLCLACHHKVEGMERSGKRSQYLFRRQATVEKPQAAITVVYGPPGSGKTTWVKQNAKHGDLIVDFDALFVALSGRASHDKPSNLFPFVIAARLAVEAQLATYPTQRAFVIYSLLTNEVRKRYEDAGAEIRLVYADKETCARRCSDRAETIWRSVLDEWFNRHKEDAKALPYPLAKEGTQPANLGVL